MTTVFLSALDLQLGPVCVLSMRTCSHARVIYSVIDQEWSLNAFVWFLFVPISAALSLCPHFVLLKQTRATELASNSTSDLFCAVAAFSFAKRAHRTASFCRASPASSASACATRASSSSAKFGSISLASWRRSSRWLMLRAKVLNLAVFAHQLLAEVVSAVRASSGSPEFWRGWRKSSRPFVLRATVLNLVAFARRLAEVVSAARASTN